MGTGDREPDATPDGGHDPLKETMATLARMMERSRACYDDVKARMEAAPQSTACKRHNVVRPIDLDASARATHNARAKQLLPGEESPVVIEYRACPRCAEDAEIRKNSEWLLERGVPRNLLHCAFSNYFPENPEQKAALKASVDYTLKYRGFLILIGYSKKDRETVHGCGKSHLGVSIMRKAGWGMFATHQDLMNRVRDRFSNPRLRDTFTEASKTKLLVLDELGLNPENDQKDVSKTHELLSKRYNEKLSTVITTNRSADDFRSIVGVQMLDRFKESIYAVVTMTEINKSRREKRREDYLSGLL